MNEVMKTIRQRRSIRKFTDQPVPEDILKELVDAGMHAPSGRGLRTWTFTVVTNADLIKRLADTIRTELNRPGYDMYEPTALIIPSNERDSRFGKEDNACALENIFLAATSYGVGSCWINQLQGSCDLPVIRALLDEMKIPGNHVVYGLAALGMPDPEGPVHDHVKAAPVTFIR